MAFTSPGVLDTPPALFHGPHSGIWSPPLSPRSTRPLLLPQQLPFFPDGPSPTGSACSSSTAPWSSSCTACTSSASWRAAPRSSWRPSATPGTFSPLHGCTSEVSVPGCWGGGCRAPAGVSRGQGVGLRVTRMPSAPLRTLTPPSRSPR